MKVAESVPAEPIIWRLGLGGTGTGSGRTSGLSSLLLSSEAFVSLRYPASGSQLVAPQPRKRDAPQGSERRDERRDLLESKLSRAAAVGEQRGDPLDKSHHRRHLVNLFSKSPGGRLVITACPQNLEANYLLVGSLKNIITVTSPSSLDKVAEV